MGESHVAPDGEDDSNVVPQSGHTQSKLPANAYDPTNVEMLSWTPRLSVYHNFLSDDECDHMIQISKSQLYRSGVVGENGQSKESEIRTSKGTFLSRGQDKVVKGIVDSIAMWTLLPMVNGEGIQILDYNIGEKYDPHFDYFFHEDGESNGGNRIATVLMYLTTVEEGGETVFPNAAAPEGRQGDYSNCAKSGLAYKPRRGDAVLFWTMQPGGDLDRFSLHGSCPVIKGEKWSATKWLHVGEYSMSSGGKRIHIDHPYKEPPAPTPPGCWDRVEDCHYWAKQGECEKNPGFMIGSPGSPGNCMRSCHACPKDTVSQTT
eukprot:jgi/Chlat1/4765/Chrsp308S00367